MDTPHAYSGIPGGDAHAGDFVGEEVSPRTFYHASPKKIIRAGHESDLSYRVSAAERRSGGLIGGPPEGRVGWAVPRLGGKTGDSPVGVAGDVMMFNPLFQDGETSAGGGASGAARPATPPRREGPAPERSIHLRGSLRALHRKAGGAAANRYPTFRAPAASSPPRPAAARRGVLQHRGGGRGCTAGGHVGRVQVALHPSRGLSPVVSIPFVERGEGGGQGPKHPGPRGAGCRFLDARPAASGMPGGGSGEVELLNDLIPPKGGSWAGGAPPAPRAGPRAEDEALPGAIEGPPSPAGRGGKGKGVLLGPATAEESLGPAYSGWAGRAPEASASTSTGGWSPTLSPSFSSSSPSSSSPYATSVELPARMTGAELMAVLAMAAEDEATAEDEARSGPRSPGAALLGASVDGPLVVAEEQAPPGPERRVFAGEPTMRLEISRCKGALGRCAAPAYVARLVLPGAGAGGVQMDVVLEARKLKRTSRTFHIVMRAEAAGEGGALEAALWEGRLRHNRRHSRFVLLEDRFPMPATGVPATAPPGGGGDDEGKAAGGAEEGLAGGVMVGGAVTGAPLFSPAGAVGHAAPAPALALPSTPVPGTVVDAPLALPARAGGEGYGRPVLAVAMRPQSAGLLSAGGPRNLVVERAGAGGAFARLGNSGSGKGGGGGMEKGAGKGGGKVQPEGGSQGGKGASGMCGPGAPGGLWSKRAEWSDAANSYVLDFGGAGYLPSVKNIQLVSAAAAPPPPPAAAACPWGGRGPVRLGRKRPASPCLLLHPSSSRCTDANQRGGRTTPPPRGAAEAVEESPRVVFQMGRKAEERFEALWANGHSVTAAEAFAIAVANLEGSNFFVS